MEKATHWEKVYSERQTQETSWYEPHLKHSLDLIEATKLSKTAAILDAGGGDSTLADDLLARGYERLTVVDLSQKALDRAKARVGETLARVSWIAGDVATTALPSAGFDLWHDRALFHFLTDPDARKQYLNQLLLALKPRAYLIMGTFGLEGPEKCSGLRTEHYSAGNLTETLGRSFRLLDSRTVLHETPSGSRQQFLYCLFQRT